MKQLITIFALISLTACDNPPAGTVRKINSTDEIELHEYFYKDNGASVYVARFKDQPKVTTTTWYEKRGKTTVQCTAVLIDTTQTTQPYER